MRSMLSRFGMACVGAAVLAVTGCGSTGDSQVLRVGTLTDAPPAIYVQDNRFTGFDNELLRDIAQREGFQVEFVGTDFSSLLASVANGRFDIGSSSISTTSARKKTVAFSNGYATEFTSIITRKGAGLTGPSSFAGKRVGVVQGTVQDDFATRLAGADVVRFPDYNSGFAQLRTGSLDGWAVPGDIGQKYLDQNPDVALEQAYRVEAKDTPSAYAVARTNTELLNKINDGLSKAIADGTVKRLHDQFYKTEELPAELEPGGPGLPVSNNT